MPKHPLIDGRPAIRRAQASRRGVSGLQSTSQRLVERRQQERQGGRTEAGRVVAKWNAARGLPRRARTGTLRELARGYLTIGKDQRRVMSRLKALYRSWGIPCSGKQVYTPRHREQWLSKITQPGVRRRAELMYQQMDGLSVVRHTVRGELLAESRKHQAVKVLRQIPLIGPLRATLLLALMQTPHRFRSKRQLWTYSGLAVETHDSAQHRYVDGNCNVKKPQQVRGLNQNHNHEMKEIFKSTAMSASRCAGPLQDFYEGLLAKGMKPDMARLTLARKIAAITLTLWKKGERFDAEHLKSQAA